MPTAPVKSKPVTSMSLTTPVFDIAGKELRSVPLSAGLFDVTINPTLVSEVIVSAQANRRHSIAHTLRRGEVRGGGKKPWRQKGTGRARQGSTRAPHWRHGGVAFGPTSERNFARKINQQARQAVIKMLLSSLHNSDQLRIVEKLTGEAVSTTKQTATFLNKMGGTARRPLLLTATADSQLLRAGRNLPGVMIRSLERFGLLDLVSTDQLIMDITALEPLMARYCAEESRVKNQESSKSAKTTKAPRKIVKVASEVAHV